MPNSHPPEDRDGSGRPDSSVPPKRKSALSRPGALFGIALAAAAVLVFLLARVFVEKKPEPGQLRQESTQGATPFEEYAPDDLEAGIRQADAALLQALRAAHVDLKNVRLLSIEFRHKDAHDFHFQVIRIPGAPADKQKLQKNLEKALASTAPGVTLKETDRGEWALFLGGVQTHRLLVPVEPEKHAVPEKPKVAPPGAARLAIVIDDMGEDVRVAQGLAKLGVPVAFSVWPDSGQREAVIRIAKEGGKTLMIHLPMQPKGYPKVDPGKAPLLVTMTAEQIRDTVARAVGRVPGATGLNNHMGSQFTENAPGMHAALAAVKEKGLFFLDSKTTAESAGPGEARKLGMRIYQRDVFLDNVQSVPAIVAQLRKAEELAHGRGQAIAIGHPHPETLQALQQWLKERDRGVEIVPITALAPQ